ncbi:MAG: hypothetical protein D6730_14325 [Bacteroidetes bacterium]|nr:MAG: hypothetical protein D6730_14325 [Bacteroidota bacterium]
MGTYKKQCEGYEQCNKGQCQRKERFLFHNDLILNGLKFEVNKERTYTKWPFSIGIHLPLRPQRAEKTGKKPLHILETIEAECPFCFRLLLRRMHSLYVNTKQKKKTTFQIYGGKFWCFGAFSFIMGLL